MIRSPEELKKTIDLAVNKRTVRISLFLIPIALFIDGVLDSSNLLSDRIGSVVISLLLALLISFGFLDLERINRRPLLHAIVCQVIGGFGFIFIADSSTSYILVFFMITILYNVYYGSKGVLISFAGIGFTSLIKFVYLSYIVHVPVTSQIDILITALVFMAASGFFAGVQSIFDWERARMHETVKESMVEQKRLRALINNMTESVLVLDREGVIRLYNAAALALFNTNDSLTDKPLEIFVRLEDEKGKILTTVDLLPKDNRPVTRNDVVIRYTKDDTASLSTVATPIRSTFGQERDEEGYVLTMRDITREKSLEEERDEFISVISHELRTPVTVAEAGVSNAILLAEKVPNNEKMTKSLHTAHDQTVFLASMLNDLSTFARAENGSLDLNLEDFDPRIIATNLVEDYRTTIQAKGMSITTVVDPSTPLRVASNRLYIREILQNFVTNAIKYSDKGTITILVRAKDKGILYSVTDQGIGISISDQKKVFEKFFRTEDYRTRSTNGTGLGLYIVKKLTKVLGGQLDVRSEVGKGSIFSLYVPDMSSVLLTQKVPAASVKAVEPKPVQAVATGQAPAPVPQPGAQSA